MSEIKALDGWCELWDPGESNLWDRGEPSPPLIDLLERRHDLVEPITDGRRKMALVPGCGRRYDVAMLARHGLCGFLKEKFTSSMSLPTKRTMYYRDTDPRRAVVPVSWSESASASVPARSPDELEGR
ncbi:hypothetical protein V1517DRAFT_334238 [Lipomyces orientalis]|uniref:Uncharacterized protein n=1 Tax=Lipomyces orientalis TaxID=1233043 RepID=A0ACC3TCL4_9ASCO